MAIRVGILTVSDRSHRGEREDLSGPGLKAHLTDQMEVEIAAYGVVPDEVEEIAATLIRWADGEGLDLILTTGGTGFAPRDVTPEATRAVIQREAPGFSEAMRADSRRITPHALLSRAVAGIRGRTLIVNLPGSPRAALENLSVVLPAIPHGLELLREEEGADQRHEYRDGGR